VTEQGPGRATACALSEQVVPKNGESAMDTWTPTSRTLGQILLHRLALLTRRSAAPSCSGGGEEPERRDPPRGIRRQQRGSRTPIPRHPTSIGCGFSTNFGISTNTEPSMSPALPPREFGSPSIPNTEVSRSSLRAAYGLKKAAEVGRLQLAVIDMDVQPTIRFRTYFEEGSAFETMPIYESLVLESRTF
jgi:hypothetical protein